MTKSTLAEHTVHSAEATLASTQRAATQALDSMGRSLETSVERVREGASHDPIKSMLIAAATGAAVMALVNLLTRSRQ